MSAVEHVCRGCGEEAAHDPARLPCVHAHSRWRSAAIAAVRSADTDRMKRGRLLHKYHSTRGKPSPAPSGP
eukprot:scaffold1473_cov375-Prasinococcus_capsulatus_cf.AAC.2